MNQAPNANIAIIGVGNVLRGDDGIAAYICQQLEKQHLPGVSIFTVHQLDAELVEDLLPFRHILIIDAAAGNEEVGIRPLPPTQHHVASSHHMNAATLQALAQSLYGRSLSLYLCPVKGISFTMGHQLSKTALAGAAKAVSTITNWVTSLTQ